MVYICKQVSRNQLRRNKNKKKQQILQNQTDEYKDVE